MQPVRRLLDFWISNLWLGLALFAGLLLFLAIRWALAYRRQKQHADFVRNRRTIVDERLLLERKNRRDQILSRPIPEEQSQSAASPPATATGPLITLSSSTSTFIKQAEQSISREKLKDPNSYNLYDPAGVYDLHGDTIAASMSVQMDESTFLPSSMRKDISLNQDDDNELRALGDWNQRFQNAIQTIRGFSVNTGLNERVKVNRDLIHLAQDFIYSSSTYGKIIISEVYMPYEKKTIKPLNLGGMAGGDKYIVHNILFKFAVDSAGLYGSDYAAAKVAGHELKGLIQYFNCGIRDLCVPLMALVDYGGFRLIAMSILPINDSTIVYGSNDSGYTIHDDDARLNEIMKEAAHILNVKGHLGGVDKPRAKFLFSPTDLEGHRGLDRRLYLLDFSRVMPPETPKRGVKMAHLYRLLRPEFVKQYRAPLCSDAFSGFIKEFPEAETHNAEVMEATRELLAEVIPRFARELPSLLKESLRQGLRLENFRLTEAVHRAGINARYLGVLRRHVIDPDVKNLLMIDMCARVIKNNLRLEIRERMRKVRVPVEEPYIRLVVAYLNLIFGASDKSEEYWSTDLRRAVSLKFEQALTEEEQRPNYPFKVVLTSFSDIYANVDGKYLLFARIQKMTGLHFNEKINRELQENPNSWLPRGERPLDDTDLEEIGLRVKHMNIITHAQGYFYKTLGNVVYGGDPLSARRFFTLAMEKFEEALDTDPNNTETLCNMAQVFEKLSEEQYNVSNVKFSFDAPKVRRANEYYLRAIRADPADSYALLSYAQFLEKCQMFTEAEEYYLLSLEADPNNAACLLEYGNFLGERGFAAEAERLYVRASANTRFNASEEQAAMLAQQSSLSNSTFGGTTFMNRSNNQSALRRSRNLLNGSGSSSTTNSNSNSPPASLNASSAAAGGGIGSGGMTLRSASASTLNAKQQQKKKS